MINYTKGFNTLLYNDFIVNVYTDREQQNGLE